MVKFPDEKAKRIKENPGQPLHFVGEQSEFLFCLHFVVVVADATMAICHYVFYDAFISFHFISFPNCMYVWLMQYSEVHTAHIVCTISICPIFVFAIPPN